MNRIFKYVSLGLFAFFSTLAFGQDQPIPAEEDGGLGLDWITEGSGIIRAKAEIEIPAGYRFVNGSDAAKLMEAYGNLTGSYDGLIAINDLNWFVIFQFEDSGYVEDDDKDDL